MSVYQRTCAKCAMAFQSDKDWPVQTCPQCWKLGWSVTKTGKLYQRAPKADPAAQLFAAPAPAQPAPAVTASPAPVTPATNDVAGLMFVQSSLEKLVAGQERHYEGIAAILAQIRDELAIANVNRATSAPGVK